MNSPEMSGVEIPAIEFLKSMGYTYIKGNELNIENKTNIPIIKDVLSQKLKEFNPFIDDNGVAKAINEISSVNEEKLMLTNKKIWIDFIADSKFQVTDSKSNKKKSVRFFDFTNTSNNSFIVVNQYIARNSNRDECKPDLLLFINGLPLGMIECKASSEKLGKGISQLLGYQKSHPKQFYLNQVCAVMNRVSAKYGAIYTPEMFYFNYRLEEHELSQVKIIKEEYTKQDELLWALFEPQRFLELIKHFVLFEVMDGTLIKKLPRYQQWRSVQKTIKRLKEEDLGGVVWHTQGSGKSLTMVYLARMLRAQETNFENPTILILTDRKDLDQQITDTFRNTGLDAKQASSVDGLLTMLSNDYGAIFTSTIQKFQEGKEKKSLVSDIDNENSNSNTTTRIQREERDGRWFVLHQKKIENKWITEREDEVNFRTLSTKKNFYVLIDEAHRSQYGFLGSFMRKSLPNAKLIAYTGTPLQKEEKNTLKEFGGEKDYLDVYNLHQAVEDGATLGIKYIDGISSLTIDGLIDKDFDKQFYDKSEIKKALLKKEIIKKRRHTQSRYDQISEHLVNHYLKGPKVKGLKAMLVCEGRASAIKYKETLDKIMSEREKEGKSVFESKVFISLGSITANRSEIEESDMDQDYENSYNNSYEIQSIEERVREAIKNGETPIAIPSDDISKISKDFKKPFGDEQENKNGEIKVNNIALMIVSDMFLTGFDAPLVSTLYLDKPLKEHTLLQAIARVNRTHKGKTAGYIVDYYGIVANLDEALKLYGSDIIAQHIWSDINSVIPKLEAQRQRILDLLPKRHDLQKNREAYKTDAENFLDPEIRIDKVEEFIGAVNRFNKLLDIILPDPRAAEYEPYFQVFNELKQTMKNLLLDSEHREMVTKEESLQIKKMIDDYISADPVKSLLAKEISIFDREEFERLKKLANGSSTALILKNQLKETTKAGKKKDPEFFGSIEDELNRLIEEEKNDRISQLSLLENMEKLVERVRNKDQKAQNMGFKSREEIAIYNYLEHHIGEMAVNTTQAIYGNTELVKSLENPNWREIGDLPQQIERVIKNKLTNVAEGRSASVARKHAKAIMVKLKDDK